MIIKFETNYAHVLNVYKHEHCLAKNCEFKIMTSSGTITNRWFD